MSTPLRQWQARRGLKADLPILAIGEFGYCTDTKELFIGGSLGNVKINDDYTPATPANWSAPPVTIHDALDKLAAAVYVLKGGPV